MKEKFVKAIRIISIPPIMITLLITVLAVTQKDVFTAPIQPILSIIFLGILPVLAYPLQNKIPGSANTGRDGQRKLAIINISFHSMILDISLPEIYIVTKCNT